MALLAPTALALGLLAIPIILLYMLRLRRREQMISSTLLWRELVRDRSANAPWQRLRRNLLLFLQLLILAALVLALARPFRQSTGRVDGNLIVLLDSSASMLAADGETGTTRFDDAVAEVNGLIDGLGGGDQMTLITAGRTPAVLAAMTNDRQQLRRALAQAEAANTSADWAAAFTLAAASSQGLSDPRVVVISDGGLPESLPAIPSEVTFIPVGRSGENLAISALAARPIGDELDLLVSIANKGRATGQGVLSLYIEDELYDSRRIEVAADRDTHLSWTLPPQANRVEARLEPVEGTVDYLSIDDRAWTVAGGQASRRILLNSEGNLFLERLFAVLPGYELVKATGEGVAEDEDGRPFDLYIFDGAPIPDPLPPGNVLIFDPQPGETGDTSPDIQVTGSFTNTSPVKLADSPLLRDVDWRTVNIAEAQRVEAPGLEALVEAEGGPLLLAGEADGRRVVILPFDLHRSDLPLQIAFPVIMANIADWLSPGHAVTAGENTQPESIVTLIPNARAETIQVTLPNGETREVSSQASDGAVLFHDTEQTGIYTVTYRDASGETVHTENFAVNFFNSEESRIQPAETIQLGQVEVTSDTSAALSRRELWPYLLFVGLVVLLLEWWITYRRRSDRPFLRFR